jgi:serine/threonine protein phosphatase PrpC
MRFTIYQESRIGGRTSNQDRVAHCYSRDALLMVIADGMGGHLHGEIAAQIAVQYITEAFQREARPTLNDPLLFLSRATTNAHHAILDYALDRALPDAPRTTCVTCIIQDNVAYWAHAGDSRLYLIRQGKLLIRTRDHSRVQMLLEQGAINAEQAAVHPSRNRVFSCLGGNHSPQIDYSHKTPLKSGDVIVMCTDGAWSALPDSVLVRALSDANSTVMKAVPELLTQAGTVAGSGADNMSIVALMWEDSYLGETTASVETRTMPIDTFTTQLEKFGKGLSPAQMAELSEVDIESAIDEIRSAIQKYSK